MANPEKLNAPQDFKTVALFLHALTETTFNFFCVKKNHKIKSQNLNLVYPVLGLSALFSGHCFRKILLKHSYSAILFVMPWELS